LRAENCAPKNCACLQPEGGGDDEVHRHGEAQHEVEAEGGDGAAADADDEPHRDALARPPERVVLSVAEEGHRREESEGAERGDEDAAERHAAQPEARRDVEAGDAPLERRRLRGAGEQPEHQAPQRRPLVVQRSDVQQHRHRDVQVDRDRRADRRAPRDAEERRHADLAGVDVRSDRRVHDVPLVRVAVRRVVAEAAPQLPRHAADRDGGDVEADAALVEQLEEDALHGRGGGCGRCRWEAVQRSSARCCGQISGAGEVVKSLAQLAAARFRKRAPA